MLLSSSDGVAQDADALDLELDDVAGREPAAELQPGAARGRARADAPRPGAASGRARRRRSCRRSVWCMWAVVSSPQISPLTRTRMRASAASKLVGGHDAGAEHVRAVPVLGLARAHADRRLAALDVARREVVPDRVAEDAAARRPAARRRLHVACRSPPRARARGRARRSRPATGPRPRARSPCRACPCSRRGPRTTPSGIVAAEVAGSAFFRWPSKARKSRSERGRSGASSRAPSHAVAARSPARRPR